MRILALITALMAVSLPVRALEVLTTIKPLGFIAAAITDGVSEPGVLLPTGRSCEDSWISAASLIPVTERLKFLVALRPTTISPTVVGRW